MALELSKRKPRDIVFADDLTIEWKDGTISHYPFTALRDVCPCAACVDELTGRKTLDPKTIPADIHIRKCEYVGNYAIRIDWSDRHNTGIYSFRFLRDLHDLSNSGDSGASPAPA
jgi:ATP-binding protein involved in chromosome partitioning